MSAARTWGLRAVLAALALGCVAWLASCTEWAEVEVPTPPRGEAARNELYATQELARRLGATVARPDSLAQLPPAGATLMLNSAHWGLFPERAQRLKAWVDGGGHLVLEASSLKQALLKDWVPVRRLTPSRPASPRRDGKAESPPAESADEPDENEEEEDDAPAPLRALGVRLNPPCEGAAEPPELPAHYGEAHRRYRVCGVSSGPGTLQPVGTPLWALHGQQGPLMLRMAQGRGTVTVIATAGLLHNERVLKSDNALAAVAALQLRRGQVVWFVAEEAREPLPGWLWQHAWAALLLGAAALVLALWRGARRFGPLARRAPLARRSMAEQIAGTAQFLRQQGPEALLAAQVRALDAAARLHVQGYDQLDRSRRAAAIARHTQQDAAALARAMDLSLARRRTDLPATLELLETARRLLVHAHPAPRPSHPSHSSHSSQ